MLAATLWTAYIALAFLAAPTIFAARYGRSAIVFHMPPVDGYGWVEAAYGSIVAAFSVWVWLASPFAPEPAIKIGGAVLFVLGMSLCFWAMVAMGSHWRIGQDRDDTSTLRIAGAPFRFMPHPIYFALVMLAVGLVLMTGLAAEAWAFFILTCGYVFVQARAEEQHWRERVNAR